MVLDTQASGNNRKITAFIGGLDLCDGRYDTPEHKLFGDLDTIFDNDFHNPTFTVSGYSASLEFSTCLIFVLMHGYDSDCNLILIVQYNYKSCN